MPQAPPFFSWAPQQQSPPSSSASAIYQALKPGNMPRDAASVTGGFRCMADIAQNLTPRRVLASLRRTCPAGSRRVLQSPVKALQTNVVPTVILYLPAGTRGAY